MFDKYSIDVFVPEAWTLGVSLEIFEYRDGPTFGDRWSSEAVTPPILKLLINMHVVLFRWSVGFRKCV